MITEKMDGIVIVENKKKFKHVNTNLGPELRITALFIYLFIYRFVAVLELLE